MLAEMNGLEFIANMTSALVWPTIALIAVILLRTPLSDLLNAERLKRLKAGSFEIELFAKGIEDAKTALQPVDAGDQTESVEARRTRAVDAEAFRDEMAALSEVDPTAGVLASFARLERLLRGKVDVIDADLPRRSPVPTVRLGELAVEQGLWSSNELAAFRDLQPLRNIAAHGEVGNLDESRAYEFAELALRLMIALENEAG